MAEEFKQKDNSGSLFTNGRKEKETHPDFTGRIKIGDDLLEAIRNGDELQLSGWKKQAKMAKKFTTLTVFKKQKMITVMCKLVLLRKLAKALIYQMTQPLTRYVFVAVLMECVKPVHWLQATLDIHEICKVSVLSAD